MKRSNKIVLVLSGALATAPIGCSNPSERSAAITPENTYTNNHHVSGAGYYHAPYYAWFPYPYNTFVPGRGYFHGGQWTQEPHQSAITASRPTPDSVRTAQAAHSSAVAKRGGFGASSRSRSGIT